MTLLTKEQKLKAYNTAYYYLELLFLSDDDLVYVEIPPRLCFIFGHVLWVSYIVSPLSMWHTLEPYFPEIYNQGYPSVSYLNPKRHLRIRLNMLKKAINILNEQTQQ